MPENNENIPLDEMMRNLKKGSVKKRAKKIEGGELVTRADGSEAIKVKSNKRRSVQPKKEKEKRDNKRKVILIAAAVSLILLSVIAFSILLGYYNGNRFKSKIAETMVNVSGAEVELGKLDVSPTSAKLSEIEMRWSAEDVIKKLTLSDINADSGMLAFIGGGWGGSAVGIDKADLVVEMVKNKPLLKTSAERPVDFKFSLYQCSELNVNFGENSLWSFTKGSASYRVSDESEDQFSIDSGDFSVPSFGDFDVRTGLIACNADNAEVYLSMEAKNHDGVINIDGTVGYNEGSLVDLKTKLVGYSLREWLDPRARRFIKGKIESGEGTFKMKLGDIDSFDITTKMTSGAIRVNDFEFVETLSKYLADENYLESVFAGESKMTMRWTKSRIEFSDIDFKQEGKLRIKGNFTIDKNDLMTGSVKVGLPVMVLSSKKVKILKNIFNDDDGEYIWADVTLGGKASLPEDDLDDMFKEAAVKVEGQQELFEHKFNELTE